MNKPFSVLQEISVSPKKYLREWRTENTEGYEIGKEIKCADMFQPGDKVDVTGTSKGKGYQGVIKRHGFSRGRESHGSKFHRAPGALSAHSDPGKVFKLRKLPGQMGNVQVTVKNLKVVKADNEHNILLVKGAVPGPKGGLLIIKETTKS